MGFNNGYDSGYSDCEAENRKRWEREAVERYKAENPSGESSGGSSGGTRSAKVFKLASTSVSPTVVYFNDIDSESQDIQITISPPTGMDDVDGVDGTWSTTGSGTTNPKLYWTPSAPAGDWVVGDVVIVGSISANYAGGFFLFGLGGPDNTWMDDTSHWSTNDNMDPTKNTSVMIYLGNNRWKFGILMASAY